MENMYLNKERLEENEKVEKLLRIKNKRKPLEEMNLAKHAEIYHQIKQEHYFKKLSEEL